MQPIAELCELSRRRAADGGEDVELSDSNVRGGTLSRSGSRRFTTSQVGGQMILEAITITKEVKSKVFVTSTDYARGFDFGKFLV